MPTTRYGPNQRSLRRDAPRENGSKSEQEEHLRSTMRTFLLLLVLVVANGAHGQALAERMDSLRNAHDLPRLAFLVVSGDSIYTLQVVGAHTDGTLASTNDRFHLGSNTKALTAMLAEQCVAAGTINLRTGFFELFPEL
ncbi:MAG TPA: serine hydrolase, partial [Flavobacteriales bacterium]|nr:serine hydrolase [Flavobacteriales bacterium]